MSVKAGSQCREHRLWYLVLVVEAENIKCIDLPREWSGLHNLTLGCSYAMQQLHSRQLAACPCCGPSLPALMALYTVLLQIAASPSLEYVSPDEISADVFAKEKEIEMGREDLQSKPEAIRAKIAEGRVKKLVQVGRQESCGKSARLLRC